MPPLYLVFAKPALKPLEVGTFGSFIGRLRNGLQADHMPSQAAIRRYLESSAISFTEKQIDEALKSAASIAIPAYVHQKFSETYGWRNTKEKQALDAGDLRGAVDSNFDAIKPYLVEHGFAEFDLETVRSQMHKVNEEQGGTNGCSKNQSVGNRSWSYLRRASRRGYDSTRINKTVIRKQPK
ncbi:hypothetical protein QNM99_00680 [Pseudomonas sp. PCH446]